MCRLFWLELLNETKRERGMGRRRQVAGGGAAQRGRLNGGFSTGRDCRRGEVVDGGSEEHSGTLGARMMWGPMLAFFSMRLARKLMVWMVLPSPISSARMPFMLLLYRDIRNLRPPSW